MRQIRLKTSMVKLYWECACQRLKIEEIISDSNRGDYQELVSR